MAVSKSDLILIIEAEEGLRLWLVDVLQKERFKVFSTTTCEEALKMIYEHMPNLIVLDSALPTNSGYSLCRNLKQDLMLRHIPLVMLSERKDIQERLLDLELGADDYILKPVEHTDLLARIKMSLGHTHLELDVNPLSRLPGNNSIIKRTEEILNKNLLFAICYIDLDNFRSFNEKYGFNRGDDIIRFLSGLITKVVKEYGDAEDFIGHVGGDDFIVISHPQKVDKLCSKIIEEFDSAIPQFYDEESRRQKCISREDRKGNIINTPIMSISIAVVSNEEKELFHIGQISRIATELKDFVKSFSGSIYFKDRRKQRVALDPEFSPAESSKLYKEMQAGAMKRLDERTKKIGMLKEIIEQGKVNIFFQPIVHFRTKSIVGYEALMRGPENSELFAPDVLFDLAREGNMLWQLDRLCRSKILLFNQDFKKGLLLFLNTTPESIYDPEFAQIELPGFFVSNPQNLVIEITERGIVEDFEKFYEILHFVQERKIKIAIDDAGSGYVSLRNVAKLKPDYIKIDMSVIRNIDVDKVRQDVLATWFSFSQKIGSQLIAEGIETKEEYNFLAAMGLCLGQGYLFAKPGKPYPEINKDF